jgi:hypothetical protein
LLQFKYTPAEALEAVVAQNDSGWRDVDEDEDIFGDGDEDCSNSDVNDDDNDVDTMTSDPLSSSEIEGSDRENELADSVVNEEQTFTDSDDDHSGEGSQGTYGRVSHVFVDASFNDLGASVRRALHGECLDKCLCVKRDAFLFVTAAPMFSRCVRAFHLSSVTLATSTHPASSESAVAP